MSLNRALVSCFINASNYRRKNTPIFIDKVTILEYCIVVDSESKQHSMSNVTGSAEYQSLEPLDSCDYISLGLKMSYWVPIDPFQKIAKYKEFPEKVKYEIMIDGLQEETFITEKNAMFRIYEVLYHHLQLCDSDDNTYDHVRQWIVNKGLEYGFDSLIEKQLRSLKDLKHIQDSANTLCKFCNNQLDQFFVTVMKNIPKIQILVPDKYRGKTLLFKVHEIKAIMGSIDAWFNGLKISPCVSRIIIKSMTECVIYENCPCVLFKKWNC